jgi:hypothetical protein
MYCVIVRCCRQTDRADRQTEQIEQTEQTGKRTQTDRHTDNTFTETETQLQLRRAHMP